MFNVDSHKSITVEGLKLGLHLPLIETLLCRSKFQGTTIIKYTREDFILILLESHNQLIPPAKYDGLY
jgi:hypothetical protein